MKISQAKLHTLGLSLLIGVLGVVFSENLSATRAVTPLLAPPDPYAMASFDRQGQTQLALTPWYRFQAPTHWSMRKLCVGDDQYFTQDGRLGLKGQILKRELVGEHGARSTPMSYLYFRNHLPGMEELCPRYSQFNDDERLNFWVWYFASVAMVESECGRNAFNPYDPNGTSVGELQIPASWQARKWRGLQAMNMDNSPGGCDAVGAAVRPLSRRFPDVPAFQIADIDNNLSCGVEILSGVLCGFYQDPIETCNAEVQAPYGHGFWRDLRQGLEGQIAKNIQRFPLCR